MNGVLLLFVRFVALPMLGSITNGAGTIGIIGTVVFYAVEYVFDMKTALLSPHYQVDLTFLSADLRIGLLDFQVSILIHLGSNSVFNILEHIWIAVQICALCLQSSSTTSS